MPTLTVNRGVLWVCNSPGNGYCRRLYKGVAPSGIGGGVAAPGVVYTFGGETLKEKKKSSIVAFPARCQTGRRSTLGGVVFACFFVLL